MSLYTGVSPSYRYYLQYDILLLKYYQHNILDRTHFDEGTKNWIIFLFLLINNKLILEIIYLGKHETPVYSDKSTRVL